MSITRAIRGKQRFDGKYLAIHGDAFSIAFQNERRGVEFNTFLEQQME